MLKNALKYLPLFQVQPWHWDCNNSLKPSINCCLFTSNSMMEYNYFICHCTCGIHDRALTCHSHFFPNSSSTVNTKIQIEYTLSVCTYSVFPLHEHSPTCRGDVAPSLSHLCHALPHLCCAAGEACCPHKPPSHHDHPSWWEHTWRTPRPNAVFCC